MFLHCLKQRQTWSPGLSGKVPKGGSPARWSPEPGKSEGPRRVELPRVGAEHFAHSSISRKKSWFPCLGVFSSGEGGPRHERDRGLGQWRPVPGWSGAMGLALTSERCQQPEISRLFHAADITAANGCPTAFISGHLFLQLYFCVQNLDLQDLWLVLPADPLSQLCGPHWVVAAYACGCTARKVVSGSDSARWLGSVFSPAHRVAWAGGTTFALFWTSVPAGIS